MGSIPETKAEDPSDTNIPIVDLRPFYSDGTFEDRRKAAEELVRACNEVGFVYIKNHGVPQSELDHAFEASKTFYALPTDEKMKAPHPPGWAVHRGYSWPGLEKVSSAISATDDDESVSKLREVRDFKESYEIGSDHNLDQPNVWPPADVYPEWRPFMSSFYWTCWTAGQNILRALAVGLGLDDEDHLLSYHDGHHNQLRLLHYPAIPAAAVEGGKFARMPAHTDWSSITMLFQDDCGGLQVEHPSRPGEFVDVPPIEGTLVMNVGDLLMRWSNDYLKSTSHRVQLPPRQDRFTGDERLTRPRYSIPYFITTDPDRVIECLKADEEHPAKYEPITQREYSAMRARMQY
ncbi:hypothetical protein EDD37DRAFT_84087 [Exophiala viscosa]|uniref:Fe2OG dioxygenase domain-containing protein n=1 Tax=Exophiala viscosa TaxID=2486360 RepID=A0AAN6E137_9EURO|nr:hypothetical protein EDD36DRAFT_131510 [Exophiala viscosa]KAI1630160.1 hypothetical protein EDD37DRAFT_84087 [Exophiala viscosa]